MHHSLPFWWHLSVSHLIFLATLRRVSSILQMGKPRSAKPLSKVKVSDKVSRFNPATNCALMVVLLCMSGSRDLNFQALFRKVGKRALISDHITQQDTRICLLAVILQFRQSSHGKLTPSWRICFPVELYHGSDECFNEIKFVFMCLWWEELIHKRIRNFHPASASTFTKTSSCSGYKPRSFCVNHAPWVARINSEDAGSEDIHLECFAFMVTQEEFKALKRQAAGRKNIR